MGSRWMRNSFVYLLILVAVIAIVIRPSTGEVLALANRPTFDPNRYNKATPEQLRNRAIGLVAEPGSTFKVVSVSAALACCTAGMVISSIGFGASFGSTLGG